MLPWTLPDQSLGDQPTQWGLRVTGIRSSWKILSGDAGKVLESARTISSLDESLLIRNFLTWILDFPQNPKNSPTTGSSR
jgi:hypothetical protein